MSPLPIGPVRGRPDPTASWRQGYPEEVLRSAWNPAIPPTGAPGLADPSGRRPRASPPTTPPTVVDGLLEETAR